MATQFSHVVYPRYHHVETKFSVLKKKLGGDLKVRWFPNPDKGYCCSKDCL